jgi:glycerol uptake facilitator-like aquaporin
LTTNYSKAVAAEAVGTAFLLAAVVGSGIMAERLAGGNVAIALLANTMATGAALLCLILALGRISGAHFNPVVTLAQGWSEGTTPGRTAGYIGAQVIGALAGVAVAHLMFEQQSLFLASTHVRSGTAQALSEFVATFGLLLVIGGTAKTSPQFTPFAVASYITAAYWFTASTSFANPAVAIARSLTNSFSGIRPIDLPGFIASELCGAVIALMLMSWLLRGTGEAVLSKEVSP